MMSDLLIVGDDVSERAAFQEFHDHPQFIAYQITVVHFHNILIVVISHDGNLQKWRFNKMVHDRDKSCLSARDKLKIWKM